MIIGIAVTMAVLMAFVVGLLLGVKLDYRYWMQDLKKKGFIIDPEFGKAFTHVYFTRRDETQGEDQPMRLLPAGRPLKDRN